MIGIDCMRKIFAPIVALIALFAGFASAQQEVRVVDGVTITRAGQSGRYGTASVQQPMIQTTVCSEDTLSYPLAKSSSLRVANMNGGNSAAAFGQYYDAPQPISISKLRFYAYKLTAAGGASSNVVVEIYNARPDSLPMGAPLRSATVQVDTNFYGGSLEALQKVAVFPSPVTVTGGYVVVVRNSAVNPVGIVINDYLSMDGNGEWCASAQITGIWRHSYNVNVSGNPFNCDMLLDPVASYTLRANFVANPGCVSAPSNVTFQNTSSPILRHRMYNYAAFIGRKGHSVVWDFGDSTGAQRQVTTMDTVHYYNAAGSYTVSLMDTLYGWSKNCAADTTIQLGQAPEAMFSPSVMGLSVQFANHSLHGATSWYWTFGDGTTSTLQNPMHVFATGGSYQVCLYSSSNCGTDSVCRTVLLSCPLPVAAFSSIASNLEVNFADWSSGNVIAWEWSFGDGATSTVQNPTHIYASNGNYLVHLRSYNACGMDSSWYWLSVTCPIATPDFAHTANQLSLSFTDLSAGGVNSWQWDFGDGSNSSLQNPIHNYTVASTYQVCLEVDNGCGIQMTCKSVEVGQALNVAQALDDQIQVYPNPVASELHIQAQLAAADQVQLVVSDLRGATVKRIDLGLVQSSDIVLDVKDLAVGSYLLSFQTSNGTVVKRVNVMR
jgi:PKD repeat protein